MHNIPASVLLTLTWLTRLPVGQWLPADPPPLAKAAWAFPIVGLVVGGAGALAYGVGSALHLAPSVTAILAIGAMMLVTGGLHEDGLADFADGMGGATRERRLEIMRDSRIGSYGALTLGMMTALRIAALASLPEWAVITALLTAPPLARAAVVLTMSRMNSARSDGLGRAAGKPNTEVAAKAILLALLALIVAVVMTPLGLLHALVVVIFVAAAQFGVQIKAQEKLGGLTGDVLGAVEQITLASAFVAFAMFSV